MSLKKNMINYIMTQRKEHWCLLSVTDKQGKIFVYFSLKATVFIYDLLYHVMLIKYVKSILNNLSKILLIIGLTNLFLDRFIIKFNWVPTSESTQFCWLAPFPWSHRWSWLSSVSQKVKAKEKSFGKELVGRRSSSSGWKKNKNPLYICMKMSKILHWLK